jgi:DNA repair protein RecO (recombination protein O)
MQWSDDAIVLSARKYGEGGAVVHVLTPEHGRHAGLVRGGTGRRQRGNLQVGNQVRVSWRGRLDEHLGSFTVELTAARAAAWLDDAGRLGALTAAAAVVGAGLPERESHPEIYTDFCDLMGALDRDPAWARAYVRWELALLADLGFGLDLGHCASTGSTEDLIYVSPRSGRAVSAEAGLPYKDKLLILPDFLRDETGDATADPAALVAGLKLTGHFLSHHVLEPHGGRLPPARIRLVDRLSHSGTTSGI